MQPEYMLGRTCELNRYDPCRLIYLYGFSQGLNALRLWMFYDRPILKTPLYHFDTITLHVKHVKGLRMAPTRATMSL